MNKTTENKDLHRLFQIGIWSKGANALFEIILGVLFFFNGIAANFLLYLAHDELIEDPEGLLASSTRFLLPYVSGSAEKFASWYLLTHGIVKIFLVVGLLRRKLWAYPTAMAFFTLFVVYQLYRYTHTHSIFLIILTVFDIVIICLTWREYASMKRGSK